MAPPPSSALRRLLLRLRPALLASGLAAVACAPLATRSPAPAAEPAVEPSLEQVFQQPPVCGTPPEAEALSADGAWLLYRWSPPPAEPLPEGEPPPGTLRLVATAQEAAALDEPGLDPDAGYAGGRTLARWLDLDPDGEAGIGPWTWSFTGAQLAVASGRTVHLLEPASGSVRTLVLLDAPEDGGDAGDGTHEADEESPEEPSSTPFQSLAFAPDGRTLRAFVDGELYAFPLEPAAAQPLALADAEHASRHFASARSGFDWSDDLRVVFRKEPFEAGTDAASGDPPPRGDEQADDGEPAAQEEPAPPRHHVWWVDEERGVTLEGLDDLPGVEAASLSPDGLHVFAVSWDRSGEPAPTVVPDYLSERVSTSEGRRLLAEDGPSPSTLWMWDARTGAREELLAEPAADSAAEPADAGDGRGSWWVDAIGWAPRHAPDAPARYAFQRTSADFRDLEVWVWSAGSLRRVWHEHDPRWVGGPVGRKRWTKDGRHLLLASESTPASSTPGRCQLFALDPEGGAARQLTSLAGELRGYLALPAGGVVFEGSQEDPGRLVIGRLDASAVDGDAPADATWLPAPAGWNTAERAAHDGSRVVFRHERSLQPAELWAVDAAGARPLTRTRPPAFDAIDWIRPTRLWVRAADGARVAAHVYLPPGVALDAPGGPPRATIVFVHGAGYLQNVTDSMTRYPLNMMFHSRLARMGYPVVDVDYRGSAGYGNAFRTDLQYHLGGLDLEDIHAVLDELVARGLVDPARVGLYGGSYGGFLTLMALFTAPERWSVGAALRSVTDWRTYHPRYTQPRLGRPSTHAEAYARSSPIDLWQGLRDPLLILHGMRDRNVFAQDSIRLIETLIDHGKEFEAMLYPSQGHGFVDGPHWLDEYRRIERFLVRHLGPPLP